MHHDQPILPFCMTCRNSLEAVQGDGQDGTHLARAFLLHSGTDPHQGFALRRTRCMSPRTRSCIVSLRTNERFSCILGDPDASESDHGKALRNLIHLHDAAPEGFPRGKARPGPLRVRIPGSLPGSASALFIAFELKRCRRAPFKPGCNAVAGQSASDILLLKDRATLEPARAALSASPPKAGVLSTMWITSQ